MKTAIDIELIDKVQLSAFIDVEETLYQLRYLLEKRRIVAENIIDNHYDRSEGFEMLNYFNSNIKILLGI